MIFENIHKVWNKFEKLHDAYGSISEYVEKGIDWDKVVYLRHLGYEEYVKIMQDKGVFHFQLNGKEVVENSKEQLAYNCDLYDKDGKLLNIAIIGF